MASLRSPSETNRGSPPPGTRDAMSRIIAYGVPPRVPVAGPGGRLRNGRSDRSVRVQIPGVPRGLGHVPEVGPRIGVGQVGRLDPDPAGAPQPQPEVAVAPGTPQLDPGRRVFDVELHRDARVLEEQRRRL